MTRPTDCQLPSLRSARPPSREAQKPGSGEGGGQCVLSPFYKGRSKAYSLPYSTNPTAYSLQPTPHSLQPTPHSLQPTPYTLQPKPYSLNPTA